MTALEKDFITILNNAVHFDGSQRQLVVDDWKSVFDTASNQNFLPLIYNAASEYPGFTEFDEAHPEYMMSTMKLMSTQVQNTSEFLNLYRELLKFGITQAGKKGRG